MSRRDELFADEAAGEGSFRFDERVVEVFPDMIDRSVPGYSLIVPMIGQLARRYVQAGTVVHDLGSSLGAVSLSIQDALAGRDQLEDVRICATDNSRAMCDRFRSLLKDRDARAPVPVEVREGDIRNLDFRDASFVVLNFTLQFLDLADRDALLRRIAEGLKPGGALVLAEKVRFEDPRIQERQTEWHHDYKRLQGYSELEIARKRTALERVLLSETEARHLRRLEDAGFSRSTRWFQCFAFSAWLSEK